MIIRSQKALLIFSILALAFIIEPAFAQGLGSPGPCQARNAAEVYCVQHGGCARDGYCYFPDGSYCDIWSFFNGTCPGRAYYEEMIWQQEAYRWLNGDYYSPYQSVYYTGYDNHYHPPYGSEYMGYWQPYQSPTPFGSY
jgi:hypothetical protein